MAVGTPIDPAIKAEILDNIRNQGMRVSDASTRYGVKPQTIYYWLRSNWWTATRTSS